MSLWFNYLTLPCVGVFISWMSRWLRLTWTNWEWSWPSWPTSRLSTWACPLRGPSSPTTTATKPSGPLGGGDQQGAAALIGVCVWEHIGHFRYCWVAFSLDSLASTVLGHCSTWCPSLPQSSNFSQKVSTLDLNWFTKLKFSAFYSHHSLSAQLRLLVPIWNTKCYCGWKRIPLVLWSFPFPSFFLFF